MNKENFSIGQQDCNGNDIMEGSLISGRNPDGEMEVVAYVKEWAAFLGLTAELHEEYLNDGIDALAGYEPWQLMLSSEDADEITIIGHIKSTSLTEL